LKRIDNESNILSALFDRINSPEVKVNILEVAKVFLDENAVRTDMTPANLATLVCLAGRLGKENIKMATLPKDSFIGQMLFSPIQNDDTFAYVPDTVKVQQAIDQFKAGIWP
jgi:anionic cell wall polymer biosynthesis LytR-Cps2A-Psr (LCP) family protein